MSIILPGGNNPPPSYEDLTLEEALDELDNVEAFLAKSQPAIERAYQVRTDLRTMIQLRMQERRATKYVHAGWRAEFRTVKQGSAAVTDAAALRARLEQIGDAPAAEIEAALPVVTVVAVKPDLRKVRKLAEYGGDSAKEVTAHIVEARLAEVLVIERIAVDVTPRAIESE